MFYLVMLQGNNVWDARVSDGFICTQVHQCIGQYSRGRVETENLFRSMKQAEALEAGCGCYSVEAMAQVWSSEFVSASLTEINAFLIGLTCRAVFEKRYVR